MRLYIRLSGNKELIPFNYQQQLTGAIHKWLGRNNELHGNRSMYCFSWLKNTRQTEKGINLTGDSYFFFSSHDAELIKQITNGILKDPSLFHGGNVVEVQIKSTPSFSDNERFFMDSPILLKKRERDGVKHVTYLDDEFNSLLTNSVKSKLAATGMENNDIKVELDKSYLEPRTKLIDYKGVKNKTTLAPIIISGTPEQIAFTWNVGLGNSTGIGFGAIK